MIGRMNSMTVKNTGGYWKCNTSPSCDVTCASVFRTRVSVRDHQQEFVSTEKERQSHSHVMTIRIGWNAQRTAYLAGK